MQGIERSDDDAAERAVGIVEAPRELNRPLAAGPADHRLADEQIVAGIVDLGAEVLAVGDADRRVGLRAGLSMRG